MKSIALHNLGCKVNGYEMDVMQQILQEKGYKIVPFDEKADIYIINTCTVTNIADQKSRQMLHRAKKKNPDAPDEWIDKDMFEIYDEKNSKFASDKRKLFEYNIVDEKI